MPKKIRPNGDNVRSGAITLHNSSLRDFGMSGYNWTRISLGYSSNTDAIARYLDLNASNIYPSGGPYYRWRGYPVRCLVYQLKDIPQRLLGIIGNSEQENHVIIKLRGTP